MGREEVSALGVVMVVCLIGVISVTAGAKYIDGRRSQSQESHDSFGYAKIWGGRPVSASYIFVNHKGVEIVSIAPNGKVDWNEDLRGVDEATRGFWRVAMKTLPELRREFCDGYRHETGDERTFKPSVGTDQ